MSGLKSMTDVAYDVLSTNKSSLVFGKLWTQVSEITGANMSKMAQFYTNLTLDNRFVSLEENKWDLRERHKYAESHIDFSEIEVDDDDIDEEENENGEENEESSEEDDDYSKESEEDEY